MNPFYLLIIGVFTLLIAGLAFLPHYGLVARIRRDWKQTDKILFEDALKYIFHSEHEQRIPSAAQFALLSKIDEKKAQSVFSQLRSQHYIEETATSLSLTESGTKYALRIIRRHRLWERYLADQTNVEETQWHDEANEKEHLLSDAETEELSKKLGNPLYDPHGDPIPTIEDGLPAPTDLSILLIGEGEAFKIIHIEDEPPEIYSALRHLGFTLGMKGKILKKNSEVIELQLGGKSLSISTEQGLNISVERIPSEELVPAGITTLDMLDVGASATVTSILPSLTGIQRRRLFDMGIIPGTTLKAELKSIAGDPTAYRVRGSLIAIRSQQAKHISIENIMKGQ
jgi:DtxR family Mn-dependent transcriptional regulator